MARRQKISQMTPKGANLQATDLLEISELSGTGYITKSITGQEIINAGGGGGSQDLQQVTDIGQTSTNGIAIIDSDPTFDEFTFVGFNYIEMQKQSTGEFLYLTRDAIEIIKTGGANGRLKVSNVTNSVTLEFPDKTTGSYTIATTSDIPSVSGFVPYTGATADVNLGTFDLDAAKGTFTHNGSTDTLTANHTSGSGIGLSITKGGANEGLKVNKTSGSGNAATIIGTLEATTLVKTGGTSAQYLMADGSTNTLTQANILSKLGWFTYNRVAESTAVTGTTAETIIENITIPANTYASGGIIRSYNNKFRKVGNNGTLAIRLYIGATANNLTGATLVGTFSGIIASQNYVEMLRTFTATTSGILGFSATQSSAVDTGNSSTGRLIATIDWTIEQNFMITVQLGNASDSVSLIGASLKNF